MTRTGTGPAALTEIAASARLDQLPPTRWHRKLTLVVGIGAFFDLYEIFLGGVLGAVLAEPWHLSHTAKSWVIASAFLGMFVGANVLSVLADRFGRRTMFLVNLGGYALFSLLCAAAPNVESLVVLRFLAGLGLGAELVLVDTYLAEFLPRAVRGRYIAWAYTLGFLGVPAAALFGAHLVAEQHLLGLDGWRWLLIAGALGAAFIQLMRTSLPESPRWLAARGRTTEAGAVVHDIEQRVAADAERAAARSAPVAGTARDAAPTPERPTAQGEFTSTVDAAAPPPHTPGGTAPTADEPGAEEPGADTSSVGAGVKESGAKEVPGPNEEPDPGDVPEQPVPEPEPKSEVRVSLREMFRGEYRRRTVMWWIFQVLQTVGYYGFGSLAPVVLTAKGHTVTESLAFSALSFCGYPLGSALSIPLIDRIERKTLIILSALGIAGFGLVFGFAAQGTLIVTAGFLLTVCSNIFSNAFHVYQTEIFPTGLRSSAIGIAYSLSRLTSVILPFIALSVLDSLGATAVFTGSAVLMLLLCLDVAVLGPRATGRSLERI